MCLGSKVVISVSLGTRPSKVQESRGDCVCAGAFSIIQLNYLSFGVLENKFGSKYFGMKTKRDKHEHTELFLFFQTQSTCFS